MMQTSLMPSFFTAAGSGPGGSATLGAVGEQWLADRRTLVKASTYYKYASIWRLHIRPCLGACPLAQLDTSAVSVFRQTLLEAGLAPKTVHDVLFLLSSILRYAAGAGYPNLMAVQIRYPREPRRPVRVLTRAEQQRFVAFLRQDMDPCKFGVLLALMTGIRLGELCALRWGHISFAERSITIDATMQRLPSSGGTPHKTQVVITSPKTDAGVRVIPMSDTVLNLCREMGVRAPGRYVLTGTDRYMEPRILQSHMQRYARACGLDGVHFHTLRHTFATRSVEVGFEIKSLSEILGHSSTVVTLNRYVHTSMELKRNNMNKLASIGL